MSDISTKIEELKTKEELTEQDLLDLNIGIVPSTDSITLAEGEVPTDAVPPSMRFELRDGSLVNYVNDHIHHWFNTVIYDRTINLPQEDKDRYFQMITEYGDIIEKLLNDENNIIYEYVKGNPNPWLKLEEIAKNSNSVVDYERPAQLIKEYQEWKSRQG